MQMMVEYSKMLILNPFHLSGIVDSTNWKAICVAENEIHEKWCWKCLGLLHMCDRTIEPYKDPMLTLGVEQSKHTGHQVIFCQKLNS